MGGAPYFRLRQGGGPTFVTSIVQLYAKVRPGLHTLELCVGAKYLVLE